MGVDITNISLTAGTNNLTVTNNGNLWSWDSSGRMRISNQTACQTGSNQGASVPQYITLPSGWQTIAWTGGEIVNRQTVRQGNRFYAPVTGMYFLTTQAYMYSPGVNTDYVHPLFSVNGNYGGTGGRGGAVSTTYRMRKHGIPNGAYFDNQISELKYLITGDWVELVHFHSAANTQFAFYHAFFAIALLG